MSDQTAQPGELDITSEPITVDPPRPGGRLGVWALVLSILGFVTCGLTSLIGLVLAGLSLKRGGVRATAVMAIAFGLISGGLWIPYVSGPYLLGQVSPRYAVNRSLDDIGLPDLPPSATNVRHDGMSGLFSAEAFFAFECEPDEARAFLDQVQHARVLRIGPRYEANMPYSAPAWYRPDTVTHGLYIREWPWGPAASTLGIGLDIVYDADSGTIYIHWVWS